MRQLLAGAGHDQDVARVGAVDGVVSKVFIQRLDHRHHQWLVNFVKLKPLQHDTVGLEIAARKLVKFAREQARYTADPGVGRLRHDDVKALLPVGEKGLGVLDRDDAARVLKSQSVARPKTPCCRHHLLLDFDGVDALQCGVGEQHLRRQPRAHTDIGHRARIGLEQHRQRGTQHHGHLVDLVALAAAEVDGGVGLAVGAHLHHPVRRLQHRDGGGLAIAVEQQLGLVGTEHTVVGTAKDT